MISADAVEPVFAAAAELALADANPPLTVLKPVGRNLRRAWFIADAGELDGLVTQVLAAHPKVVEDWKAGKKAALGFLVGQVMKSTQGRANPAMVNALLAEKLPKV